MSEVFIVYLCCQDPCPFVKCLKVFLISIPFFAFATIVLSFSLSILAMTLFRSCLIACVGFGLLAGSFTYAHSDSPLELQAKNGDIQAQLQLGSIYLKGLEREQDFEQAAAWFKKAAAAGNAEAQYQYARLCLVGRGVSQSYYEAAAWFKKAAEQNHAKAQVNLAYLYESGHGVEKNRETARAWYEKACNNGNNLGCTKLKKATH